MKQAAAVIGLGFVGRAHLEALRRVGVPVRGMLGGSRERDEQLRESLGLPLAYASLDDLAADPSVSVVHICTPNHVHFDQATRMLRAGKHVLCEKPLAMDSRESEMLVKLARERRCVGGVAYNLRYYPLCHEAKAAVTSGVIGQPRLVHGSFLQDWLLFPTDWNWRLDPKLGGELRAVSDIGTHWLDLMMWITARKVTEVCADLATVVSVRQRPRGRVETFQKAASLEHRIYEHAVDWTARQGQRRAPQRSRFAEPGRARLRRLSRRPRRRISRYVRPALPRFLRLFGCWRLRGAPPLPHVCHREPRADPLRRYRKKRARPRVDPRALGVSATSTRRGILITQAWRHAV